MFGLVAIACDEQQKIQRNTARIDSFFIAGMVVKRIEEDEFGKAIVHGSRVSGLETFSKYKSLTKLDGSLEKITELYGLHIHKV